jgi:hypothetical protein
VRVGQIDPWLKYGLRAVIAALALLFAGVVISRWNEPLPSFITDWTTAQLAWLEIEMPLEYSSNGEMPPLEPSSASGETARPATVCARAYL